MPRALAAAAVLWLGFLAAGTFARMSGAPRWLEATVYAAGTAVCHQRPERSFHTDDVKWPVCARCSGLYIAAPLGAIAAALSGRRLRRRRDLQLLAAAAVPTAITFALEHGGVAAVASMSRFIAALPLGAALAWVIVSAAAGPEPAIE